MDNNIYKLEGINNSVLFSPIRQGELTPHLILIKERSIKLNWNYANG